MDLYFLPLAGSLASRIALYEAGAEARYIEVDPNTRRTSDGDDFAKIYPLALVPLLRCEDGSLLGENAAVLQYIANRYPEARLAPIDQIERARLQQWLSFTSTELHQGLFCQLFDQDAPEGTRAHALNKSKLRLDYLDGHLNGREFLLDSFTVADAYLYTVLSWSMPTRVALTPYPSIKEYCQRLRRRPSISTAFQEELALYRAQLARHEDGVKPAPSGRRLTVTDADAAMSGRMRNPKTRSRITLVED
jgi:glutathione S-transferase